MNDLWAEKCGFYDAEVDLCSELTLNNEKSALISLLDGCDEFVAIDDIDVSSSSIFLQMSSSFVALDVLDAGNTANRRRETTRINNEP